jgi:PPOX class probable F420-dependent enzyme
MTDDEVRAFLMSEPAHTGKLATTRKDGSPHVAPIWYVVDDDGTILFHTGENTLKGRTLRRDPRAALCVDDEQPPFSFVIVNGTVAMSDNPADSLQWATIIGGRYMGADQAGAYGKRNAVPGELLCRLTPTTIVSEQGVAS